ncbi:MAG: hypothetical protein E7343_06235 [Clostridiales bacterium]|nr:hypothetical protein [Clostridiales bacterium]
MKKSKLITMALSFLLTIGMVSAGFAAWVISADVVEEVNGTVSVDEIVDKRIDLDITATDTSVYFGKPSTENTKTFTKPWFTNDDNDVEDLTMSLSFKINNLAKLKDDFNVTKIKIAIAIDNSQFGEEVLKYIKVPTTTYVTSADNNGVITLNETGTFTATLNFDWTDAWNTDLGNGKSSRNPYNYFNSFDANAKKEGETDSYATKALNAMTAISQLNSNLQQGNLKIVVTASIEEFATQS